MMGINTNPLETLSLTQKKAMVTLMDLLLTETNLSAILKQFVPMMLDVIPGDVGGVHRFNPHDRKKEEDITFGVKQSFVQTFHSIVPADPAWQLMMTTLQPITNRTLFEDHQWECQPGYNEVLRPYNLFHYIAAPVVVNAQVVATIHMARSRGQPFSTNEQLVMNKLAQYLAYSIKNLEYKKHKILFETKGERSDLNPLTVRELEVLHLVADGLRDTDIADQLGISVYTVKEHLKRIYAKLKVSSRLQAVIKAFNLELI